MDNLFQKFKRDTKAAKLENKLALEKRPNTPIVLKKMPMKELKLAIRDPPVMEMREKTPEIKMM